MNETSQQQATQPTPAPTDWLLIRTRLELVEMRSGLWAARDMDRPALYGWGSNAIEAIFDLAELDDAWTPSQVPSQV